MNKNQRNIRNQLKPSNTSFGVPRKDYDKGQGNSRFVNREIPFGHQKRKSTKPKVAHK